MEMPGGGPFHLAPGQITDDSELAMMMTHGLLDRSMKQPLEENCNREDYLVLNNIAKYYKQWIESPPFDIGITTRTALSASTHKNGASWKRIQLKAKNHNQESLSNGSLMRATPMVIYTSLLEKSEAKKCIEDEVAFLHPNQTVKDVNYLYGIAIHYLINNPLEKDRAQKAFDIIYEESTQMQSYICSRTQE